MALGNVLPAPYTPAPFPQYRIEVSDPLCYKLLEDKKIVNGDVVLVYAR